MAYDERLAERIRERLIGEAGIDERQMFGGVAFLLYGNVCVAVWHDELVVRVGRDAEAAAMAKPGVREFDITGRAMRGWVLVAPEQLRGRAPATWVSRGVEFARTIPRKSGSGSRERRAI